MDKFNYTMLCDFYELTMGNGYFVSGMQEKISYFDLFFRQIPDGGGFAIACGLEQVINYIENLHFDEEDIEFLRSKGIFDEGFLEYLKDFRFTVEFLLSQILLNRHKRENRHGKQHDDDGHDDQKLGHGKAGFPFSSIFQILPIP